MAEQAGGGTGEQVLQSGSRRPAIPGLGLGRRPRVSLASSHSGGVGAPSGDTRSPARSWLTEAVWHSGLGGSSGPKGRTDAESDSHRTGHESAARRRKENAAAERRKARPARVMGWASPAIRRQA